jgi:pyridoxamine 5'-phosphate oxidase
METPMDLTSPPAQALSAGALRARSRRQGTDAARLGPDPLAAFRAWHAEWSATGPFDPAAMTLATVDAAGRPDLRVMDLVGLDHGFLFMTHAAGPKANQLSSCPHGALVFAWLEAGRQVRVRGPVAPLTAAESDATFAALPPAIRLAACATCQGATIDGRHVIEQQLAAARQKLDGATAARPGHWQGYRLVPLALEFWQQRPDELQDRILFQRPAPQSDWRSHRLSP